MNMTKIIAYFMLGLILGSCGIGIFTQPVDFLLVMLCVAVIDVSTVLEVNNE